MEDIQKARDKQLKILNGQRPKPDRSLCEKGIFQKLTNLYETEGLFYGVFQKYEILKKKYKGMYKIINNVVKWNDGNSYLSLN